MTHVFVRDGFIDRYTGTRLIFPGALRLISEKLPALFPYHPHGKMSECHMAYWELLPTVDHVIPVSRGGRDAMENWVTTSMRRNGVKANWTLEELGWSLLEPGDVSEWDGLMSWFLDEVEKRDEILAVSSYFRRWYRAATDYAAQTGATTDEIANSGRSNLAILLESAVFSCMSHRTLDKRLPRPPSNSCCFQPPPGESPTSVLSLANAPGALAQ